MCDQPSLASHLQNGCMWFNMLFLLLMWIKAPAKQLAQSSALASLTGLSEYLFFCHWGRERKYYIYFWLGFSRKVVKIFSTKPPHTAQFYGNDNLTCDRSMLRNIKNVWLSNTNTAFVYMKCFECIVFTDFILVKSEILVHYIRNLGWNLML